MQALIHVLFYSGWLLVGGVNADDTKSSARISSLSGNEQSARKVLVLIDGDPITAGDLDFFFLTRSVSEKNREKVRRRFLEELIDRRVMRAYLKSRKIRVDKLELDARIGRINRMIRKNGDEPKEVLARLGYTEQTLRTELSLPLAWQTYLGRVVTPETVREYFDKHRAQFDGTEVRARQIYLKQGDAEEGELLNKLQQIRTEISSGKITFAEAALKYSEAPTREQGGDVGFFPYRGKMPLAFTRVAFPLKVGELSEPFVTRFGGHLATVTERKPGDLSLEDVRPAVLSRLSGELWNETVAKERAKAKIEWQTEAR